MSSNLNSTSPFDRYYLISNFIIFGLFITFGMSWLARCERLPSIDCNINFASPNSTVVKQTITPQGKPMTKSHGWLNNEEIAIFSPPAPGEPQNLAKFEIYNVEDGSWRVAELSSFFCGSIYARIEFKRLYQLQNGNPAIEIKCFNYNRGTKIYEMIPNGDEFEFEPIFTTENISTVHSDIEIAMEDSAMYLVHKVAPPHLLKQSISKATHPPSKIFSELTISSHSLISLTNDESRLAISSKNISIFPSYSIYQADLKTNELKLIFGKVRQLRNLHWSADGESLLFTGKIIGREGIWLLDIEEKNLNFIHPLDYSTFEVYWSPENRYILFETNHDNDNSTPTRFEIIDLAS